MRLQSRGWWRGLPVVAIAAALVLPVGSAEAAPGQKADALSPEAIMNEIEDELYADNAVPFDRIDVSFQDGTATLSGTVSNILAKERAERLTQTVKGVADVDNQIAVRPRQQLSDEQLANNVKTALRSYPVTEAWEVDASADDGQITLTGTVDSWQEKQVAAKVAKSMAGVTRLDNQLDIVYAMQRTDDEIAEEARNALKWDAAVDGYRIDVQAQDGTVALTGVVGSAAEKQRAIADAWVAGVNDVDASKLNVFDWASLTGKQDRPPAQTKASRERAQAVSQPEDVRQAIMDAFERNPEVPANAITVSYEDGKATLRGKVDNLSSKREAADTARQVMGVQTVANRIKVRPDESPLGQQQGAQAPQAGQAPQGQQPEQGQQAAQGPKGKLPIEQRVENLLEQNLAANVWTEPREIQVNVYDGIAELRGTVDSIFEKAAADDVAAKTPGVVWVDNNLDVRRSAVVAAYNPFIDTFYVYDFEWFAPEVGYTLKSDAEIADDVRDELWWSPFVDSGNVKVDVQGGVVNLSGKVDSAPARAIAAENAFEAGATWVVNDLDIE